MNAVENFLQHYLEQPVYDPAKAHDYYIRTRQLKGKPTAAVQTTAKKSTSSSSKAPAKKPTVKKPVAKKPAVKAPTAQQIQAQITALQARFDKLKAALAELVKQAQARSGDVDASKTTTTKQTPAQKKASAAASKKYYDEHKDDAAPQTPSEQVKQLQQKIADIQAKIKKMQEQIKASAAKKPQKPKADSVGVAKHK